MAAGYAVVFMPRFCSYAEERICRSGFSPDNYLIRIMYFGWCKFIATQNF